jgi:hypothetical protein
VLPDLAAEHRETLHVLGTGRRVEREGLPSPAGSYAASVAAAPVSRVA